MMQPMGNSPAVVMKAFVMAYEGLGLSNLEAANLLGISERSLRQSVYVGFDENAPETEVQLAFVRFYHLLYALSDGDTRYIRSWMNRHNVHLDGVPSAICHNLAGIQYLSDYLESMQVNKTMPTMDMKGHLHPANEEDIFLSR